MIDYKLLKNSDTRDKDEYGVIPHMADGSMATGKASDGRWR